MTSPPPPAPPSPPRPASPGPGRAGPGPHLDGRDPAAVLDAARRLAAGELLAFATETVYGLGARADEAAAVARVFAAKGRPADHPLIVHLADAAALPGVADWPAGACGDAARALARQFWPGPLTLILPRRPGVAEAAAGGQTSLGVRVPSHPVAAALLRACAALGVPGVAAPSANRFGRVSPTRAQHVLDEFGGAVPVLDGGDCAVGIESAIVDCSRAVPALLRPGALPQAALEAVIGQALAGAGGDAPRAPGTLESHYAPAARLRLWAPDALRQALQARAAAAGGPDGPVPRDLAVYSSFVPPADAGVRAHRALPASAAEAAHELFAVLRDFDATGASQIWVERPPPDPAWDGVRDRLQRAAA